MPILQESNKYSDLFNMMIRERNNISFSSSKFSSKSTSDSTFNYGSANYYSNGCVGSSGTQYLYNNPYGPMNSNPGVWNK